MSSGLAVLAPTEEDITKMVQARVHVGDINKVHKMKRYIHNTTVDGINIFDLNKTWEKLVLAARIIVTIENPADVCIVGSTTFSRRGLLKYASHTGATSIAGRFTPGTFTNQITNQFKEPRLIISTDPATDKQALVEASYANIPIIAFCNPSAPLKFVDVAIPCNTNSAHAMGLMMWFLSREVLRLRGSISRSIEWDIMPDLYFYRDPKEEEEEEAAAQAEVDPVAQAAQAAAAVEAANFSAEPDFMPEGEWAGASNAATGTTTTIEATTGGFAVTDSFTSDNWTA